VNSRRKVSAALLGLLALVVAVWFDQGAWSAEQHSREQSRSAPVPVVRAEAAPRAQSELPSDAAQVWRLIQNFAVDPDR
jgi:hypothetical protein